MTKSRAKPHFKTNPRVKLQQNKKDYFDFSRISETLGILFSPLLSSIYFSFPNPNIKKVSPTRIHPKNASASAKRTKSYYSKKKHQMHEVKNNIITIDLHKIEENLRLNCKQTKELKDIVEIIKCESSCNSRLGKVGEKLKRDDKSGTKSRCEVKESKSLKKEKSKNYSSNTCKDSAENKQENRSKGKSGQISTSLKHPATKRCECDSGCAARSNPSSTSTRSIIRAKPEMNIGNLRIRCIRPVCVVYAAHDSEEFSQAALKAHLGSGQCPDIHDSHVSQGSKAFHQLRAKMSMHHLEDDENYVIAKGTLTEELVESFKALKEIRKSLFPQSQDDDSFDAEHAARSTLRSTRPTLRTVRPSTKPSTLRKSSTKLIGARSIRPTSRPSFDEPIVDPSIQRISNFSLELPDVARERAEKPHWDVESFPSTLYNLEKDFPKPKTTPEESHSQSMLSKLKACVFSALPCACLSSRLSPSISDTDVRFSKIKKVPSSYSNKNLKAMRTTESEFLNRKNKAE